MKTKASKKAVKSTVIKAVKAKAPVSKVKTEPVSLSRGIGEPKKKVITRLTKEMLDKRQQAKVVTY